MWSAVQDLFRWIYAGLRILFPNLESTQPVLVEFAATDNGAPTFGIIKLRDPRDFNYPALTREILTLTQNPRSRISTIVQTVDTNTLEVRWDLEMPFLIRIPVLDDFEFQNVFAMMESRGWKDHFVVHGQFARANNVTLPPIPNINGGGLNWDDGGLRQQNASNVAGTAANQTLMNEGLENGIPENEVPENGIAGDVA
jgi:hypothetical protein